VGRRLGALGLRSFIVLEGGYAEALADCVTEFVDGWENP
jgi:acetoin utilization deacetylase AcuC-like enzyme